MAEVARIIQRSGFCKISLVVLSMALVGCSTSTGALDSQNSNANFAPAENVDFDTIQTPQKLDAVSAKDVINRSKKHVRRTGEIYLMRGLANVFSRGIDKLASQMRGSGYDAVNFSYAQWQPVAQDIIFRAKRKRISYPIIIIGHSLGGNESSKFANHLAEQGVKVDRVFTFDPVETGYVGKNIGKVVNYYLPKEANNIILAKDGFTGSIENRDVTVDPEITHTNVDKNAQFQGEILADIGSITKKRRESGPQIVER